MGGNLPIDGNKETPKTGFTAGLSAGVQKNGGEMMPNSVVQFGLQNGNTTGHVDIGYGGKRGMTSFGAGVEHDIDLGKGFSLGLSADARVGVQNNPVQISVNSSSDVLAHTGNHFVDNDNNEYVDTTDVTTNATTNLNVEYNPLNIKIEGAVLGKYQVTDNFSIGAGIKGGIEAYNLQHPNINLETSHRVTDIESNTPNGSIGSDVPIMSSNQFSTSINPNQATTFSVSPVVGLDVKIGENTNVNASAALDSDTKKVEWNVGLTHKFGGKKQRTQKAE